MTTIKSKNPLTVYEKLGVDAQFSNEQLIHLLQNTPAEHIYKRPAKGGGQWEFVTGTYIKKVLNYTFGFLWSSEVKEVEDKYGQVVATVRLTIHKPDGSILIWKEDIGKKDIMFKKGTQTPLDYGNDKKAAITDGLKRCAAQFGIASDVYGKEEFKEIQLEKVEQPIIEMQDEPATEQQIKIIKSLLPEEEAAGVDEANYTKLNAATKIKELMMEGKK